MNKLHEITFMLSAKASNSNGGVFQSTAKSLEGINEHLNKMNSMKIKVDKYADLNESIGKSKLRIGELKNAETELTSKLKKSDAQLHQQKVAVEKAEGAYLAYRLQLDGVKKTTEAQRQERKKLKDTYTEEKKKLTAVKNENKAYAKELEGVRKETSTANRHIKTETDRIQKLEGELESAGVDTKNLAKYQDGLASSVKNLTEKQKKYQETVNKKDAAKQNTLMYAGLAASSAGVVAALSKPTQNAMQFESAMADVRKVVNFDTPDQFNQMSKDIMKLSETIPMLKGEIASIVAAGGQAGLDKSELVDYAASAAKMGVAFDIEASYAGEMMAQWRSAFKMNQKEVNALADKINYLGNTTAAEAPKIANIVKRIGPLGEVGGVASGSIAALGASMVAAGTQEEIAATGIKNLILNLTKGDAATKKQKKAFEKLGTTSKEIAKVMQEDSEGTILSIMESVGKLSKDEQASVLTQLFGSESVAAITPLLTNLEALKDNLNKVSDETKYAGSMEQEFETRANTGDNAMILAKNSLSNLSASFGQMFIPAVKKASKVISKISQEMRSFIEEHPLLAKVMGYTIASGAVLATTIFGLLTIVAGANFIFTNAKLAIIGWDLATKASKVSQLLLKGAMLAQNGVMLAWTGVTKGATLAMKLLNLAMAANPVGLLMVGVMTLATVFIVAYKKSERFRNVCNKVKKGVVTLATAGFGFITGKIDGFKNLLASIVVPAWIRTLGKAVEKGWNFFTGPKETKTTVTTKTKRDKPKKGGKHTRLAKGGIVTKPTFAEIGEGGESEAVMPLSKLNTLIANVTPKGADGQKIEYKPTYIFNGGTPEKNDLVEAESISQQKFNQMMNKYEKNKRRTKFALA